MFNASWPGIWRTQTADKAMGDETCHRLPLQTSQAYSRVWCAWGLDLPHWYTYWMQIALCPTLVNHNKLLSMTSWALLTSAGPALLTPCSLCAGSLLQSTCNWGWSSSNDKRGFTKRCYKLESSRPPESHYILGLAQWTVEPVQRNPQSCPNCTIIGRLGDTWNNRKCVEDNRLHLLLNKRCSDLELPPPSNEVSMI
jgi:hypothetical protein